MKLAVLPGDDIGPEITAATLEVLDAADQRFGLGLEYDRHEVGMASHRAEGTTLPESVLRAAQEADGMVLGPAGMTEYPPLDQGGVNVPGTVRKRFELYANIRPARSRIGVANARPGLDCVIVRENTEGFYADRSLFNGYGEFMPTEDVAMSMRVITARASRRIATVAFERARQRRGHVTVVGKRHVLQVTDGLFMDQVRAVAADHPDVELREIDIDAMAAAVYTQPGDFDVILTTNMFGDILSNLTAALSGGLGLSASLNVGDDYAAANAGHGSAPDIAGRGIANPTSLILSSALLLRWWSGRSGNSAFEAAASRIEEVADEVLAEGKTVTADLGGSASTIEYARELCSRIAAE
ncbi:MULTISPECIES: isocitrate/isopropylmalate dehydrogenase family protein [unclassified Streptomyces]|uniref:isocitrate/isopropylmalate dehydrogenase family protein n=1 Tax=unclassified Streptomyces TaxID=2593676 RepID=UPI00168A7DC2|nr:MULTISPECIES: isocitrate/isopropylmalate family dehydrogenase [unclassified Streptomyces]MBD3005389.1 isocitrate/isopropylmalate dehydrogenase family protein [Streptomyces sp. 5-10]